MPKWHAGYNLPDTAATAYLLTPDATACLTLLPQPACLPTPDAASHPTGIEFGRWFSTNQLQELGLISSSGSSGSSRQWRGSPAARMRGVLVTLGPAFVKIGQV